MMQVNVVALDKEVFVGEAKSVTVPTTGGETTILPHHMPYVSPMGIGKVEVKTPGETKLFTIGKGLVVYEGNTCTIMIEDVAASEELSEKRSEEARKKAEEIMRSGATGREYQKALYQYRRSTFDLDLIKRRKRRIAS
jgi:F-type H+-transporting ATPase subunit epsilon